MCHIHRHGIHKKYRDEEKITHPYTQTAQTQTLTCKSIQYKMELKTISSTCISHDLWTVIIGSIFSG